MQKVNINLSKSVAIFMIVMAAAVCFLSLEVYRLHRQPADIIKTDTLIFRDTIFEKVPIITPMPVASRLLRYDMVSIPRFLIIEVDSGTSQPIGGDSVAVRVPIEQKVYSDDSLYTAWISGFHPSLDSLIITRPIVSEKSKVTVRYRDVSRISLGVSLGAGYGIGHRQWDTFIGLAVQIRLF